MSPFSNIYKLEGRLLTLVRKFYVFSFVANEFLSWPSSFCSINFLVPYWIRSKLRVLACCLHHRRSREALSHAVLRAFCRVGRVITESSIDKCIGACFSAHAAKFFVRGALDIICQDH